MSLDRRAAENRPNRGQFSKCDRFKLIPITAVLYTVDIGTDALVAVKYYAQGDYAYFGLTLALVLASPLITVLSNVRDYWPQWKSRESDSLATKITCSFRIVCSVIFPLAPYPR